MAEAFLAPDPGCRPARPSIAINRQSSSLTIDRLDEARRIAGQRVRPEPDTRSGPDLAAGGAVTAALGMES